MGNKTIDRLKAIGVGTPDILIPNSKIDLRKWAVVACDQYTSEQSYWKRVENYVGNDPSTLRLIFPEAYLEEPNPQKRIDAINATMSSYVENELFTSYEESFFLVHRTTGKEPGRWGLLVALDLEQYDYAKESRTLIRATEGTIVSRIPPRKQIRKDAPLELPHILVLISDAKRSIIEPLVEKKHQLPNVYDTDLMEGGGHITAYQVSGTKLSQLAEAFEALHATLDPANPLMFAMGDGNHSLATAKSCWEDLKKTLSSGEQQTHPARYALVELENIFDPGLEFEPIHRVLFSISRETFLSELEKHCSSYEISAVSSLEEVNQEISKHDGVQRFGYVDENGIAIISVTHPEATIPAGTLQSVIDVLVETHHSISVDYIHGDSVTEEIGSKTGNIGLFLPAIDKNTFFDTIISDGALPRKTFSMGEAHEKRFYMEARKITLS
jgi:hypothetical protein